MPCPLGPTLPPSMPRPPAPPLQPLPLRHPSPPASSSRGGGSAGAYSRCLCRSAASAAGAARAGLPAPRRSPPVTVEGSPGRGWICSSGRGPRHRRVRMKRIRVCAACGGAQLGGGLRRRRGGGAGGGREAGSGGEARRESGKDNGW
jgi:hypothetical protein